MPTPRNKTTPTRLRQSSQRWFLAAVVLSLALCLAITWLHFLQDATIQNATLNVHRAQEARNDLTKGFLYLTLSENPSSAFRREEGLALMLQALHALESLEQSPQTLIPVHASSNLQSTSSRFLQDLELRNHSTSPQRETLEASLRSSFHQIERQANHLDAAAQDALHQLSKRLDSRFSIILSAAVILLSLVCLRVYTASRNYEQTLQNQISLENQFTSTATTVPGVIYSLRLSPDGSSSMPFATPTITQLTGLTPESLKQSLDPLLELIAPDDAEQLERKLLESARNLSPFRYTFRLHHPGRGETWIEASALPQTEPSQAILWHGFAQNVTRKHQEETALKESEERYRRLSQTETDAIIMADTETGQLLDANDSAINLYGYTRTELLRLTLFKLTQQQNETRELIEHRESKISLVWHRKKDGSVFPTEMFVNYFHYQGREVYFAAIRDISERWQAEKALLRRASELQQRNNELARFNNVAVGRELRMIQLKEEVNQLLANAGHPPRYNNEAANVLTSENPNDA